MEAIAAVASIAGILTLLGECLSGTKKLKHFFSNVSLASVNISVLVEDITSLLQAMHSIWYLLEELPPDCTDTHVISLQFQLIDYSKDMSRWFMVAQALRPPPDKGVKTWFKKLRVAINIKSVNDTRKEIDRHKQAFLLNLSILGRYLDVATAANVKDISGKVDEVTTASLSKIDDQNKALQKIEKNSQKGMHSSAASVKSLASIATSLSRIEARVVSIENSSKDQSNRVSNENGDEVLSRSPSSKGREHRTRRSGSINTKRSSYNSHRHSALSNRPSSLAERPVRQISTPERSGSPAASITSERTRDGLQKKSGSEMGISQAGVEPEPSETNLGKIPEFIGKQYYAEHMRKILHQEVSAEYQEMSVNYNKLFKQLPDAVVEYIMLIRSAKFLKGRLNVLQLSKMSSPNQTDESGYTSVEQTAAQDYLDDVKSEFRAARARCILEGHSLHDIDQRLRPPISNETSPDKFWDQYNTHGQMQPGTCYLREICNGAKSVYGTMPDRRDRINNWMLHCLCFDDTLVRTHRSILAEAPSDDGVWAKQLIQHWFIDEAAMGPLQNVAFSVGAVDSREGSGRDRPASNAEVEYSLYEVSLNESFIG